MSFLTKVLNEKNVAKIKDIIARTNPEAIKYELSSLSGNHLTIQSYGSATPIFQPNRNMPIIRTIYGCGLKCFSSDAVPKEDTLKDCDIVIGYVRKNGFGEYKKDDYILALCLKYVAVYNINIKDVK